MNYNELIQITIVGIIVAGASLALLWRMLRKRKKLGRGGCCGCAIQDACAKKNIKAPAGDCIDKQ